ncbi:unnamed protein product [Closterium sp. NIES-53]
MARGHFSSCRALEARSGFLTVAPPWGLRDALLCPSCAPWRAAVPCPSRAPGRTAVLSPGGLVRAPPSSPVAAPTGARAAPIPVAHRGPAPALSQPCPPPPPPNLPTRHLWPCLLEGGWAEAAAVSPAAPEVRRLQSPVAQRACCASRPWVRCSCSSELVTEPVTPVVRRLQSPVATVRAAPVARVSAASPAVSYLLSSHSPSSSSLVLCDSL